MKPDEWQVQHQQLRHALQSIMDCQLPVIAAVNGAAYGGGFELALACDFIYATKAASFALPEATLGIMPGMGGTQNLPRAVGLRRAKEILYTGKPFTATEAYDWGIVNTLCDTGHLEELVSICALSIVKAAPASINSIKRVTNQGINMRLEEALNIESNYYNRLLYTKDRIEGITAFNEKRKPNFSEN